MRDDFDKTKKILQMRKPNERISNDTVLKTLRLNWKAKEEAKVPVKDDKELEKQNAIKKYFENFYQRHFSIEKKKTPGSSGPTSPSNRKFTRSSAGGRTLMLNLLAPKLDEIFEKSKGASRTGSGKQTPVEPHDRKEDIHDHAELVRLLRNEPHSEQKESQRATPQPQIGRGMDKRITMAFKIGSRTALDLKSPKRPGTAGGAVSGILKQLRKGSKDQNKDRHDDSSVMGNSMDKGGDTVEKERLNKIAGRAPPKGLLLKQRKLLSSARQNALAQVQNSGFTYFESDVNVKDDHGNTPLYYVAKHGNLEFAQFLVDHGARVNEPCERHNTPLHVGFGSNKEMLVILLISKGGNLNALNDIGQTPLAYGSERLLDILELKGGIATFDKGTSDIYMLPKGYDNNKLVDKYESAKKKPDDGLTFLHNRMKSPGSAIHENFQTSSYVPYEKSLSKSGITPR
jgi:ankyrin repeat protein